MTIENCTTHLFSGVYSEIYRETADQNSNIHPQNICRRSVKEAQMNAPRRELSNGFRIVKIDPV